jgi:hypothetical protein
VESLVLNAVARSLGDYAEFHKEVEDGESKATDEGAECLLMDLAMA